MIYSLQLELNDYVDSLTALSPVVPDREADRRTVLECLKHYSSGLDLLTQAIARKDPDRRVDPTFLDLLYRSDAMTARYESKPTPGFESFIGDSGFVACLPSPTLVAAGLAADSMGFNLGVRFFQRTSTTMFEVLKGSLAARLELQAND